MVDSFHLPPDHPRNVLRPYSAPGLFITGTGTDVGKTVVASAIAGALHQLHFRVGLCKPVASGCPQYPDRQEGAKAPLDDDYVPIDSIPAATAAGIDLSGRSDEALLRYLAPVRYAAPAAPSLAAEIENRPIDWRRIAAAFDFWQEHCEVLLVEGVGGWYVPLQTTRTGAGDFYVADLAVSLRLPVLVVTDAELGAINRTLLTIHAIRERNLPVVGMVINRVPPADRQDFVVRSNVEELPRLSGVPVRGVLPALDSLGAEGPLPRCFIEAMLPFARDWSAQIHRDDER